jgi:hypothetical protein
VVILLLIGTNKFFHIFCHNRGNHSGCFGVMHLPKSSSGCSTVVGRSYLLRQAETLLKLARVTADPQVAAAVIEKAGEFKSQIEKLPDTTPQAPDVENTGTVA